MAEITGVENDREQMILGPSVVDDILIETQWAAAAASNKNITTGITGVPPLQR